MKILLLSVADSGGGCYWIADAINKYTEHKARSVRCSQWFFNYPFDVFAPSEKELLGLIKWADVVNVRDNVSKNWPPIPHKKPAIVTFTGMSYRRSAKIKLQKAKDRGWLSTVSTSDLLAYAPKNLTPEWLPNPREKMQASKKYSEFTACQAFGGIGERKGAYIVRDVCKKHSIRLEQPEGLSYIETLRIKARCHILIDQIGRYSYGYGNNAIEAWALDMPVISGASHAKFTARSKELLGHTPYLESSGGVDDLIEKIELLKDPKEYKRWVDFGLTYFYQYHHIFSSIVK